MEIGLGETESIVKEKEMRSKKKGFVNKIL